MLQTHAEGTRSRAPATSRRRPVRRDPERERARAHADALLRDIKAELGDADAFTRDDLLGMPSLTFVAVITRYRYVGEAVRELVADGRLAEASRTELCLPARLRRFRPAGELAQVYADTVRTLARREARPIADGSRAVSVAECVHAWRRSDQHLSEATKRTVVRSVFTAMVRDGAWRRTAPGVIAEAKG